MLLSHYLDSSKIHKPTSIQIPKIIHMCNKILDAKSIEYSKNWKKLNPDFTIRLSDESMKKTFLQNEFPKIYADIFDFLEDGPIKADFWRICVLYKHGGVYSDIDIEPLIPLSNFIEPNVGFVTCSAYRQDLQFNPSFIIAPKECVIIKNAIDWYIKKYENKEPYNYWGWSIMQAFTDTFLLNGYTNREGIYIYKMDNKQELKVQIIQEVTGKEHYDAHNLYKGMRVFNNRYKDWDHVSHSFILNENGEKGEKGDNGENGETNTNK
jgi:hypothetical protein